MPQHVILKLHMGVTDSQSFPPPLYLSFFHTDLKVNDVVPWVLDLILSKHIISPNPHVRQAACIWLLSMVKKLSTHKAIKVRSTSFPTLAPCPCFCFSPPFCPFLPLHFHCLIPPSAAAVLTEVFSRHGLSFVTRGTY